MPHSTFNQGSEFNPPFFFFFCFVLLCFVFCFVFCFVLFCFVVVFIFIFVLVAC